MDDKESVMIMDFSDEDFVMISFKNIDVYNEFFDGIEMQEEKDEVTMVKDVPLPFKSAMESLKDKWVPFSVQDHYVQGKRTHSDLRIEDGDALWGITILGESPREGKVSRVLFKEEGTKSGLEKYMEDNKDSLKDVMKGKVRVHEVTDNKLVYQFRSERNGSSSNINGYWMVQIAHIENDQWITLFKKLKEQKEMQMEWISRVSSTSLFPKTKIMELDSMFCQGKPMMEVIRYCGLANRTTYGYAKKLGYML